MTHVVSIVAVERYFNPRRSAGKATGTAFALLLRLLGIIVTIILTGLVLANRNKNTFPMASGDQDLLKPAYCFLTNVNATEAVQELHETLDSTKWAGETWTHGLLQLLIFGLVIVISVPLSIVHSLERGFRGRSPPASLLLIVRTVVLLIMGLTLACTFMLAWKLRNDMKHPNSGLTDVQRDAEHSWTFSQLFSLVILVLAPITAFDKASGK